MASRFVSARRISDKCRKLYDRKVTGVGILNHGSDDTATSECATGCTFRENPGGISDGISTDGTEAVATKESQLTPPRIASTRSQTIALMTVEPIARIAMDRMRFLRFRMMFDGADHRLTGGDCDGMPRKSTVESK